MYPTPDLVDRIHAIFCTCHHPGECDFYEGREQDCKTWEDFTIKLFEEKGIENLVEAYTALSLGCAFTQGTLSLALDVGAVLQNVTQEESTQEHRLQTS